MTRKRFTDDERAAMRKLTDELFKRFYGETVYGEGRKPANDKQQDKKKEAAND